MVADVLRRVNSTGLLYLIYSVREVERYFYKLSYREKWNGAAGPDTYEELLSRHRKGANLDKCVLICFAAEPPFDIVNNLPQMMAAGLEYYDFSEIHEREFIRAMDKYFTEEVPIP